MRMFPPLLLVLSAPHSVIVAGVFGFRFDNVPHVTLLSALALRRRPPGLRPPSGRCRDLFRRRSQTHIQGLSPLLLSAKESAVVEDDDDDSGTSRGLGVDPSKLFLVDRGRPGDDSASRAYERSRHNRDQLLGLLSSNRPSSPALEGTPEGSLDPIRDIIDDEDDGFSIALDADEYVTASTNSNGRVARNEVMVAALPEGEISASWRGADETASSEAWGVPMDPAYRAVLEALVNDAPGGGGAGPTARSGNMGGISEVTASSEDAGGGASLHDLVRVLETQQGASASDARRAAMQQDGSTAAKEGAASERLHALVFANEQGFWNQSEAFREGLTDPKNSGARQVLAERRSAVFQERNALSMRKLEERLDRLQQTINAGGASDPASKASGRCPRCRSVLTEQDVELMKMRGTRLCPVCTAEVRLVSRKPATTTTAATTFAPRSNVVAPFAAFRDGGLASGNRRVYRTRPPQALNRRPIPRERQRHPDACSRAPPVLAPNESSDPSQTTLPFCRDESSSPQAAGDAPSPSSSVEPKRRFPKGGLEEKEDKGAARTES